MRPYKSMNDFRLSEELDKLEKTGTVPGSPEDKERARQIDAIRHEFRIRAGMDAQTHAR